MVLNNTACAHFDYCLDDEVRFSLKGSHPGQADVHGAEMQQLDQLLGSENAPGCDVLCSAKPEIVAPQANRMQACRQHPPQPPLPVVTKPRSRHLD